MNEPSVELVTVPGGALAVEVVEASTTPVLAIHGVSSQRRLWDWLRAEAPQVSLIAPDLRGRGDSVEVSEPYGIARHTDDMIAILDGLGLDQVHVCGMSMGGFVAIDLALRCPQRVSSLVLVDGGFPMAAPAGLTREMLPAVFADRIGRLEHEWQSLDDYLAYFVTETAPLLDPADGLLRNYLAHDLVDGRVRLSAEALLADAGDIFFTPPRWTDVSAPIRLLYAEWSTGRDTPPAYTDEAVAGFHDQLPALVSSRMVAGVDHAGIVMSKTGAAAIAEVLEEAL